MRDYYSAHTLNPPSALEAELIALGLYDYEYKEKTLGSGVITSFIRIKIPIDDSRLPDILGLKQKYQLLGTYYTEFDDDDYADATWLEAEIVSWIGYPKPENSWQEVTYDLTHPDYCRKCGAGFVQINQFRFAKRNERGKTIHFCQPGWVYDALFVRSRVKDELTTQGIKSIDFLPAIEAGSKKSFEDVIQILFGHVMGPALLNTEDFPSEVCTQCQRRKWVPMKRVNRFNRTSFSDQLDMVLTHEWFGSGALAYRKILVSRRFAELLQERRWRGLRLRPIVLE